MEVQFHKLIVPLSENSTMALLIESSGLTRKDFQMLHTFVDGFEIALLGPLEVKKDAPKVAEAPKKAEEPEIKVDPDIKVETVMLKGTRKQRVLKQLPPCNIHPDSKRHGITNRCLGCMDELMDKMHKRQRKQREVEDFEPSKEILVEVETEIIARTAQLEYSRPTRCPKCGAGMVRLQRKVNCDIDKDCWVHPNQSEPAKPCVVKIAFFKHIVVDQTFKGEAA